VHRQKKQVHRKMHTSESQQQLKDIKLLIAGSLNHTKCHITHSKCPPHKCLPRCGTASAYQQDMNFELVNLPISVRKNCINLATLIRDKLGRENQQSLAYKTKNTLLNSLSHCKDTDKKTVEGFLLEHSV